MSAQNNTHHQYGLIGFPLGHSFSKKYFTEKFESLGLKDHSYELFPLEDFDKEFPALLRDNPGIKGLNVTIPFKEKVIPYLDSLDEPVKQIGAVNCIAFEKSGLKGYNTDAFGFEQSLLPLLRPGMSSDALILGTGGSAKAVAYVLKKLEFRAWKVSRTKEKGDFTYNELDKNRMKKIDLIVNCTPLGMAPDTEKCPPIPYNDIGHHHILFDLVYNPEKTLFLQLGAEKKCTVKNGYEMLSLQAEKSWEIWKNLENQYRKK